MAKTYAQVARQIESLQQQADALKKREASGVIARIREAIDFYGLTAEDLGLSISAPHGARPTSAAPKSAATARAAAGKRVSAGPAKTTKRPSMVRFKDSEGHTWTGMGRKPGWLVAGLDGGKTLDDFAVKPDDDGVDDDARHA